MSVTNFAVAFVVGGNNQGSFTTELVPGPAAAQNTATRINTPLSRVLKSVSAGSLILPSILSGEANELLWVMNDSPNTINVYPAVGEKTNGSANAAVSVAAGASGVFVPVLNSANNYPSTLDWRAAVIS